MKHHLATKPPLVRDLYLFALVVWSLSADASHALQLGKHRGAAVMGQPLNISVQATVDGSDDLAAGCVEADVFYADSRVQKSSVRVSTEKSSAGGPDALIRIQSTLPIDEPVVTVYLRAGCQRKVEKRYVVLADLLSEPAANAPSVAPVAPPQGRSAASSASSGPNAVATSPTAAQAREAGRIERETRRAERKALAADAPLVRKPKTQNPSPAATDAPPAAPSGGLADSKKSPAHTAKTKAPETQKSRLKLEPLELLAERDPNLKVSAELRSAPATDPAQRAAAAALWRAIAAQPEDILNDSQKLKSLESVVSVLQLQMKQNQQGRQDLSEDVKKAQSERFSNPLVYGLALVVFAAAMGLAWLFRKRAFSASHDNAVQPWWRKSGGQRVGWADSAQGVKPGASGHPYRSDSSYPPDGAGQKAAPASFLDLDLTDDFGHQGPAAERAGASGRQDSLDFKAAAGMHRGRAASDSKPNSRGGFALSAPFTARAVKAEELFDVQQQADFFVSLGQKDQAIEVLRLHIEESEQTSALVYLDLLSLYHQTKEELEFEAFRLEFNARFNAEMPAFDAYNEVTDSAGLQGYPTAMSRIVTLWPLPKVVTVIEESLFRQADVQTPTFDLEAYRELLLLYAMIKDILHSQASGKSETDVLVAPLSAANGPIGFGADHDFQADRGMENTQTFAGTAVVPLTATPGTYISDVEIDFDLTSDGNNGFKSVRVEPAGASLPADKSGTIDMLQTNTTRAAASSTGAAGSAADRNAIDFDLEQFSQGIKPTLKKTR